MTWAAAAGSHCATGLERADLSTSQPHLLTFPPSPSSLPCLLHARLLLSHHYPTTTHPWWWAACNISHICHGQEGAMVPSPWEFTAGFPPAPYHVCLQTAMPNLCTLPFTHAATSCTAFAHCHCTYRAGLQLLLLPAAASHTRHSGTFVGTHFPAPHCCHPLLRWRDGGVYIPANVHVSRSHPRHATLRATNP